MSDIYVFDINKFREKQQNKLNGGVLNTVLNNKSNTETNKDIINTSTIIKSESEKIKSEPNLTETDTIKFKYNIIDTNREKINIDRSFWRSLIGLK